MKTARLLTLGSVALGTLVVGGVLVLGGCISWRSYPADWPVLEPMAEAGCADITGDYAADTPYLDPPPDKYGRSETLGTLFGLGGSKRAKITAPHAGELNVGAWYGDTPGPQKLLSNAAGDYNCSPDGIRLRKRSGWIPRPNWFGAWGWQSEMLTLQKTVDGSLVVRKEGGAAGVAFFIIPVVISNRYWYRFPPYQSRGR
jgi:hypothetical protein